MQPALAAGLLVLMFIAERMLGEHAGRYEYLAVSAIVIGVVGAGPVRADAQHRPHRSEHLTITLVLRRPRRWRACCPTCCGCSRRPQPESR